MFLPIDRITYINNILSYFKFKDLFKLTLVCYLLALFLSRPSDWVFA